MKISNELLNRLVMTAQQVLAPDKIGFDVNIHLTTGLVYDVVRAVVEEICPCNVGEPCSSSCTCANQFMSGGCSKCSKYGSEEQRLYAEVRQQREKFIEWIETVEQRTKNRAET